MKNLRKNILILLIASLCVLISANLYSQQLRVGAECMEQYLDKLSGKKVGLVANQTSVVRNEKGELVHLLDTLLSLDIDVCCVFSPEHGFRGNVEAGASVQSGRDFKTGVSIVSLYGKNKKPTKEQIQVCDILVFDLQDVGCRFYTYISTLHYVMEACAENNKPLLVLDRPNPNDYVDGPVLEDKFKSFVGMHNVPVVYGLTIGEYATMINGEGWLSGNEKCDLKIVALENWFHGMDSAYELPIAPSPNLPNSHSIELYPSLCLFEGTPVSVGRGTDKPFQIIGYPTYCNKNFSFVPIPIKGVSENPPYKNQKCYGLTDLKPVKNQLNLSYIMEMYSCYKDKQSFFTSFFNKLVGTEKLKQQIVSGMSEEKIRDSWQKDLENYNKIKDKYTIYERK
jgi:uncharacterized protein YbbC (DUF1343 family)